MTTTTPTDPSADRLMERYARGERAAFDALYTSLAPWLRRRLYAMVRDHARAEDLLQATFLKLHRARERYRPGASVAAWLLCIARRVAVDELRRSGREVAAHDDDACASPEPCPLAHLEAARTARRVEAALAALPEPIASALYLARVEGLAPAEIAARAHTTANAIRIRTHRGAAMLRLALAESRLDGAGVTPHHRRRGRAAASDHAAQAVA